MLCPKCNSPIGVYATQDIVREHAEDYGYVKLPTMGWLEAWLIKASEDWSVKEHRVTKLSYCALTLHSALQGGKHA